MAATDVLSLEAGKEVCYRSPSDVSDDVLLQATLTALSNRLDQACGPIVRRSVTEQHDGGGQHILLRYAPVAAITSITEWDDGADTVLTAESNAAAGGYLLRRWLVPDPPGLHSPRVERRSGRWVDWWAPGEQNIVVVYEAGRYATTAEVAATRFGEVARLALGYLWKRRDVRIDADYSAFFPATVPHIWRQIIGADWAEGLVVA